MAAGDFTASALLNVLVKADRIWADNMVRPDFEANTDVMKAVLAEQNAQVNTELNSRAGKDLTVEVAWVKNCDETDTACTDDCSVGGAELESDTEEYTISKCRKHGFNVKEKQFRSNLFDREEVVAKGILKSQKVLDEYVAQTIIASIDSFAGVNAYTGWGTVSGTATYQPTASEWGATTIPQLILAGIKNRFSNPYILTGINLWLEQWNADMQAGNADGKGDARKFKQIAKYFDLFNIDAVNTPDLVTYLIDKNALAFASKNYYMTAPKVYTGAGLTHWSIPSRNIPGVVHDVVYTNACASNEITHKFSLHVHFDLFNNPTGCTATRTGILKYVKGSVPST